MARTVTLLVNPAAGRGRAAAVAPAVLARLREHGCPVTVVTPSGPGEVAEALARGIGEATDAVAVLGGDGTCHLAIQHLAGTGVPFGVVPAGTGNDLHGSLGGAPVDGTHLGGAYLDGAHLDGTPVNGAADPLRAADVVATGTTRSVDLGRAGDRWWSTVLCAGFDSRINELANRLRWPRGRIRYDVATAVELLRLRPVQATVDSDEGRWRGEVTMVAVGNGPGYGGGQLICPDARLDDGLLDVAVVEPLSRREVIRLKPKLATGDLADHPAVHRWRTRALRLDVGGSLAYADGERIGAPPLRLEVTAAALTVIVAAGAVG